MSSTDETTTPPAPSEAPRRRRPARWTIIGAAVLAVAAASGIAAAVDGDGDGDGAEADSARLGALQQACQNWMHEGSAADSDATLCSDMTGWMGDRMRGGRMMGATMWDGPQAMRDTCAQWMATGPADVDDPDAWCNDMVGWMDEHRDDWGGWMHG